MERKMRQLGIVATSIGVFFFFGLLLMQAMDHPKVLTAALKWGFILMVLLGGMGVYALSKPERAGGEGPPIDIKPRER